MTDIIKRYTIWDYHGETIEDEEPDGEWVKYVDHVETVAKAERKAFIRGYLDRSKKQ
jgi:hypothetical protein